MELRKIDANVHTFGAMIDGCARAGQLPKAFGAYGIMMSKVCSLNLSASLTSTSGMCLLKLLKMYFVQMKLLYMNII